MNDININFLGVAVLASWVPVILALFVVLPPRRAVIAAFIAGYLFLPDAIFHFHTLPDLSKVSLTALGVVLGSFMFDGGRLLSVRPRLIDLAWLVLCTSPIATSLLNGLGIMDGLSNSANRMCVWGLAYWIGRAYFTDWAAIRDLAIGMVLGGLAYLPLCWWEIRMSPQLNGQVYGLLFLSFRTDSYLFGFRPNVFLGNGLSVTMFMGVSSIAAYCLWISGSVKRLAGLPMSFIFAALLLTTVFCKALGGVTITMAGIGALTLARWPRTRVAVLCLVLAAPVYVMLRTTGEWSGNRLVEMAQVISKERAESLAFRLREENLLTEKALRHPWFGFGGFSRSHVWNEYGRDLTLSDGLWIIMLGEYGLIGLGSLMLMVLGPAWLLLSRIPTRYWTDPACGGAIAMGMVITL